MTEMMVWDPIQGKNVPEQNLTIVKYLCPRCRRQADDAYKDEEITPNCMRYKKPGRDDIVMFMTPMEVEIISTLLAHEGQVISNERIIFNIYHNGTALPYRKDVEPDYPLSSIRVTLTRLRQKLLKHEIPIQVTTIWGRGMKIHAPKNQITLECM